MDSFVGVANNKQCHTLGDVRGTLRFGMHVIVSELSSQ